MKLLKLNKLISESPSRNLRTMSQGAPPEKQLRVVKITVKKQKKLTRLPHLITTGVMIVKIAVERMPKPSVYFPPNFSDKSPPGMCVITLRRNNFREVQSCGSELLTYPAKNALKM